MSGFRVEQVPRILPFVDTLTTLRAALAAASRAAAVGPYDTVGKRVTPVPPDTAVANALQAETERVRTLFEAASDALGAEHAGDPVAVIDALLRGGAHEESTGRFDDAQAWYARACDIARELHDRRPEVAALRRLGDVELSRARLETAGRAFQRSLVLADDEFDHAGAALACRGLGTIALVQDRIEGAESWFRKGARHAAENRGLAARLALDRAEACRRRNDYAGARERLHGARDVYRDLGDAEGVVRALLTLGRVETSAGRHAEAMPVLLDAIQLAEPAGGPLLFDARRALCDLLLASSRWREADDEIRRLEELAIERGLLHALAEVYTMLGRLRGRQRDEHGFVFFETALELCRGPLPAPLIEARVCRAYAAFHERFGSESEAIAYREHADTILGAADPAHV